MSERPTLTAPAAAKAAVEARAPVVPSSPQRGVSVHAGDLEVAAPDGSRPDDVVPAVEPLIAQLAPQLDTVVAPLDPAPLYISEISIEHARSQSAAVHRRLAGAQPAAHGVARHAQAPGDA